jgi:hypothetical protein
VDIAISVQEAIEKPMDEFRLRADELGADDPANLPTGPRLLQP